MRLILFDFDGTLTTKDSLLEFLKYMLPWHKFIFGFIILSPIMLMYKLKLLSNHRSKQLLFSQFFKGCDEKIFKQKAHEFSLSRLDSLIRDKARETLDRYKKDGDKIIIVSASMRCWLEPWCQREKIELIATQLEFKDGVFSGKFATKNCHGAEKVKQIKARVQLQDYDKVIAYGDSLGDTQMLALADESHYKPFRDRS